MHNLSQRAVPKASASEEAIPTLFRAALGLAAGLVLCSTVLGAETSGYVKREVYLNPGAGTPTSVPPFAGNPNYPGSPDSVTFIDSWVSPASVDPNVENYGGRLSGFIKPAETADYVFFIASDDNGAFYLSTDDSPTNLKLVAQETVWSNALQWQTSGGASILASKRSDQFTGTQWPGGATIRLEAGRKYYAEMLWKEGGGGDNGGVTMLKASEVINATVDDPTGGNPAQDAATTLIGTLISTEAPTTVGFLRQPVSQTIVQNRPVTFSVIAVTPPGDPIQDPTKLVADLSYQWNKNGSPIPIDLDDLGVPLPGSAGTANYTIPLVATGDNGAKFTCKITTGGGLTATSSEAILTVSTDATPPTIALATGSYTFDSVTVTFDEAVDVSTATYAVPGLTMGTATVISPTVVFVQTSKQTEGANYTLTVNNVKDLSGNALVANTATFVGFVFKSSLVQYGTWQGQSGGFADWETAEPPVKSLPPTTSVTKSLFEANTADEFDNYFGQIVAWFTPPANGDYVFFVSSDDHGELYLSTDESPANKKRVAVEPTWNGRREWLTVDRRGGEGFQENRTDQYAETEWPTGATITLDASKKYYMEFLFKEGGGGDNGGVTFIAKNAALPAAGSASTVTGTVIGTYVDPRGLPPIIVTAPVGKFFTKGENITLSVVVDSADPATLQWFRNKKEIVGATGTSLVINNADVKDIGDYYVRATNKNGSAASSDNDARLIMKGAYVIEMEDYNYDNGKTVPAASVMPLVADLYKGKDGIPGVDYVSTTTSGGADDANGNSLRNGWVENGVITPAPPGTGGNLDVVVDNGGGNTVRPDFTLANNYKIGWGGLGNWYQYTRDFAPGTYNAVWVGSRDGTEPDAYGRSLELVTGDPTKADAATTVIGELIFSGTGGWSSNDHIPFLTPGGSDPAVITLGAKTTLRVRINKGDGDNDALLFYQTSTVVSPVITGVVVNANGTVTITWTGGGQLEAATSLNGTYAPIPGATGGTFTWTPGPTDTLLFGRIRN